MNHSDKSAAGEKTGESMCHLNAFWSRVERYAQKRRLLWMRFGENASAGRLQ